MQSRYGWLGARAAGSCSYAVIPGDRRVAGGAVSGDLSTRVDSSQSERQGGRAQNVKAEVRKTGERVANVAAGSWEQLSCPLVR
jgi:hypothetical protein